ncbi:MAG: hypothetical protein LBF44_03535, partial [Holosporaceae bacterium]|nr:hypothetical protein [Holosporaceae bacterium]
MKKAILSSICVISLSNTVFSMTPYYASPNYYTPVTTNNRIVYNQAAEALKNAIDLALNRIGLNKIFNVVLGNCRDNFITTTMHDISSYMKNKCYYFILPMNQKIDSSSLDNSYLKTINTTTRRIEDKVHSSIVVASSNVFVNNLAVPGGIASCNIIHYNLTGNIGSMSVDITTAWSYPVIKSIRNAGRFFMVDNFRTKNGRRTNRFRM